MYVISKVHGKHNPGEKSEIFRLGAEQAEADLASGELSSMESMGEVQSYFDGRPVTAADISQDGSTIILQVDDNITGDDNHETFMVERQWSDDAGRMQTIDEALRDNEPQSVGHGARDGKPVRAEAATFDRGAGDDPRDWFMMAEGSDQPLFQFRSQGASQTMPATQASTEGATTAGLASETSSSGTETAESPFAEPPKMSAEEADPILAAFDQLASMEEADLLSLAIDPTKAESRETATALATLSGALTDHTTIFDFDDTMKMLGQDGDYVAEDATEVVALAQLMDANIGVASASNYPDYLKKFCAEEVAPGIFTEEFMNNSELVHAGKGKDKEPMLDAILESYGADAASAVLFDDSTDNIQYTEATGVEFNQVSKDTGVTIEDLRGWLERSLEERGTTASGQGADDTIFAGTISELIGG